MNIDFSKRPHGMSKREYWSSITGRPKEEFPGYHSRSSGGGGGYGRHSYREFLNIEPITKAYDQARQTYLQELQALKPRYEALYNQLENEKNLAMQGQKQLSAEELALQKRNLAKRGIAVDQSNQFYTDEADKLKKQQLLREQETALDYARRRNELATAESADRRDFATAISNLDISKANTIQDMINKARSFANIANREERLARQQEFENAMKQKIFEYNKSKDEADRALQMYKMARNSIKSGDKAYRTALSSLVATAYSTPNPAPYTRERIAKQLEAGFPDQKERIRRDISKFFPNGWESMTPKEKGPSDTALRELLDDINKGANLSDLLKAYPDVPTDVIKKYYYNG